MIEAVTKTFAGLSGLIFMLVMISQFIAYFNDTNNATVAGPNQLARAHLVARGDIVRRSRTYCAPDDHRIITLAVGHW